MPEDGENHTADYCANSLRQPSSKIGDEMRVTLGASIVIIAVLSCTLPARAGGGDPQQVSDPSVSGESYQAPESYVESVKKKGAFLDVSLNDTIRLALTNNLEIEIEDYNEDLVRERITGQRGFYDPVLSFTLNWNSFERINTRVLDAGAGIPTTIAKSWTLDTSYQQAFSGGTALTLFFNNDRNTTNDFFSIVVPNYVSIFGAEVRQPLLRGFRQTQTERQIKLYNLDSEISDSAFKERVSQVIQRVESQYWELVFAIENHEARRRSLELAGVQLKNTEKRVEIGVEAPIEITSARAEVATREQDMISSEVEIINAQNTLKGLLSSDPNESIWNITLIPTDQPKVQQLGITMDDAIQTALKKRPEVEQIQLEVEKLEVDRKFYQKQGKPQIDLVFRMISQGNAGDTFALIPDPENPGEQIKVPDPTSPFLGDIRQAWDQAFRFRFPNWVVGVDVEIPLRNRANDAALAQNGLSERQLRSQLRSVQQEIMVDVRNAFESIGTRRKGYEAAQVARQLVEEQLEGENKRFEAGLSTNFEVLSYQRDLAQAEVTELRAIIDYQLAITSLREATFSIVQDNDFVLARREEGRQEP
jgi:HAE1 family hydrophobic/amphiphilic exporter-1